MINFPVILAAAFIPLIIGSAWYSPKLFGNAWMKAADLTEEKMKSGNMAIIFGVSFLLSFMLSVEINFMVIHQHHLHSILMDQPGYMDEGSDLMILLNSFMESYGQVGRTFGHGSFHGVIASLFFILPVLGTNALFERKSFKYIAVNVGYWMVTLALMGGVIGQWG